MRCVGLINARGGSKGIPGKNIKSLLGKPLINYSIEAGLAAHSLARLVVSTDDPDIAEIARSAGADIPFMRPPDLATDTALQIDTIRHALLKLEEMGDFYDAVVVLQPTCPLRLASDIDGAVDTMLRTEADTVISVTEVRGQHPLTMYTATETNTLNPLFEANPAGVLRQDFQRVLWRNGAIYAIRRNVVVKDRSLYGKKVAGHMMPVERSANIDEPMDWIITEALIRYTLNQSAQQGTSELQ